MGGMLQSNPLAKMNAAERNRYADLAVGQELEHASSANKKLGGMMTPNSSGRVDIEVTAKERDSMAIQGLKIYERTPANERTQLMKNAAEDAYEIRVTDKDVSHSQELQNARALAFQMGRHA